MGRDIRKWLQKFEKSWKSQDVESVLELFTGDVVYYETPTQKLESKDEIREEWEGIESQKDIELDFEVFSADEEKFTVKWSLSYFQNGKQRDLNGIYLIGLNKENKCFEFRQYCQLE
ncbi:YybH family protein [Candidatus Nanohalobium constans]|uniref:SnoaL-like domain-containing protein n=1 Tax=Candidatus Nanohalobium constans TaxID=2565781 RepID=A0A5Q0UGK6_9ARCH|nr:nuclear transport factor 2 family protein [Candidatus Nanohalobium constans]QGA80085.1 hypothetical protein LC1Nh_0179 [Candidatus Nanohalobium constans]